LLGKCPSCALVKTFWYFLLLRTSGDPHR
jgi:hypothetical protein